MRGIINAFPLIEDLIKEYVKVVFLSKLRRTTFYYLSLAL